MKIFLLLLGIYWQHVLMPFKRNKSTISERQKYGSCFRGQCYVLIQMS